ncbi:MAG: hypothetical protein OXU79_21265 [Gemmatimonadota bacterium]|nr:hypothetical protein [Gemmatimonadota bacterium]
MKPIAVALIATLLFQILAPGISTAEKKDQEKQIDGIISPLDEHRAAENAARVIRSLYEMDVRVMSRRQLDLSKIEKGTYAYVIQTTEVTSGTATGVIFEKYPDGIGIKATAGIPKKENVLYADMDTIVVSKDRRALERWQRRAQGRFVVMSQSNLDLLKLKNGWHAYVVYKFENGTRAELTEITGLEEELLVVRSSYAGGDQFWADGKIAQEDIIIIVAAEKRGDITELKNARQVIRHLPLNPRIRFNASRFANIATEAKSVVGRVHEVRQDTLVVGAGLSSQEVFRVPISSIDDFQINVGRYRNTNKGMAIGSLLGLGVLLLAVSADATDSRSEGYEWFVTTYAAAIVSFPIFVCSTLIGYSIKTEKWVEVPLKGIDMSVVTTANKGIGAAVSLKF